MQRGVGIIMLFALGLLVPQPAAAEFLCTMFGKCLYEGAPFRFTVVDKNTGQPLADVHALAEWILHGPHGRNGPLMVQDAVSGPEGVLAFPAWGPTPGTRLGLILNHDPAITLFKPGYRTLLIQNAYPEGTEETTRVRRFGQDGQTFALEPFRGSPKEWVKQMDNVLGSSGSMSDDQLLQFRWPYLARWKRVLGEREKLPPQYQQVGQFFWHVEREIKFLEEGKR